MIKKSDKTEFEAMLRSVTEMKKSAAELNRPYVDEPAIKFAKDAISECKEVSNYLISQIDKNISIWLNLNDIYVCGSNYSIKVGEQYHTKVGDLEIYFRINDISSVKKVWGYCSIDHLSVERDGFEIIDVKFYKDGKVKYYDTLISENSKIDITRNYSSQWWRVIYNKSLLTQEYTKALWEAAKDVLKSRMADFKEEAEKAENAKAKLDNIGEYKKVATI